MKAIVDEERFLGCGVCESTCPEVFELGDDNKAKVKVDPVPPALEESCREAVQACAEETIRIEEGS